MNKNLYDKLLEYFMKYQHRINPFNPNTFYLEK